MKPRLVVWGMMLLAAMVLMPAASHGEMYIEAYLGGVQGANSAVSGSSTDAVGAIVPAGVGNPAVTTTATGSFRNDGKLNAAFMGGLRLGYWFAREGFLGYNYPEWAKYLGFYLDFKVHRLSFGRPSGPYKAQDQYTRSGSYSVGADQFTRRAFRRQLYRHLWPHRLNIRAHQLDSGIIKLFHNRKFRT